jgi:hypothetical protein
MSLQLIQQFHRKLEQLVHYGGSRNETSIRGAFQNLLEQYASSKNLMPISEPSYHTDLNYNYSIHLTLKKNKTAIISLRKS